MKHFLLTMLVCLAALPAWAADDPADRFLQAYFLIQEGDTANGQSDFVKANTKFKEAESILQDVRKSSPDWNPHIIEFRIKYCEQKLQTLRSKLPAVTAAPAPAPAPSPVAPPATESMDAAKVAKLSAELSEARDQIKQLETARNGLNTKLQEALKEVPATQTNLKVEQLLEQNKEMSAQLAAAQQKIADLGEKAEQLQKAQEKIQALDADRSKLSDQLKEALGKLAASENDTRLAELVNKNKQLADELAAAQGKITQAEQAAKTPIESPELKELRAKLTDTTAKLEAAERELAATKQDLVASRQELTTVRKDLDTSRAETATLRRDYAAMREKLDSAEKNLMALQQAGQKDEEIILFLRKENALLKQIVDRKSQFAYRPEEANRSAIPELKGWHSRRRAAKPEQSLAPPEETRPAKMKESAKSQLVAEITAPEPPAAPAKAPVAAPSLTAGEAKASATARPEVPPAFEAADQKTKKLLDEAKAAVALKDLDTATAKYQAALENDPNNLLALSNLGVINYQRGKLDDAEQNLRRAVALSPNDSESRSLLGVVYLRKSKTEEAFTELTRAVALNPRNFEAHNYLGITLSEKGWAASAEQEMRRALELNPQYADAHFNLAVLYAGQKTPRLELARYHYQKALDLGAKADASLDKILKEAPAPAAK